MLRVDMWDWVGERSYAHYNYFHVASVDHDYRLSVSGYTGMAGAYMTCCRCVAIHVDIKKKQRQHVVTCRMSF